MGSGQPWRDEEEVGEATVMASIDRSSRGSLLVIADISRDDAWLTTPKSEAFTLETRR